MATTRAEQNLRYKNASERIAPLMNKHGQINSELKADAAKGYSNSLSLMMQLLRNYTAGMSVVEAYAYTYFVYAIESLDDENLILRILDLIDPELSEPSATQTPSI